MSTTRQALVKYFTNQAQVAKDVLDKWAKDFAENPLHSLKWSDKVFEAAAQKEIGEALVYMLNFRHPDNVEKVGGQQFTIDHIIEYVLDNVMGKAKYPPRSTGVGSNMVEQEQCAAWAKAHERLKYYAGVDIDTDK